MPDVRDHHYWMRGEDFQPAYTRLANGAGPTMTYFKPLDPWQLSNTSQLLPGMTVLPFGPPIMTSNQAGSGASQGNDRSRALAAALDALDSAASQGSWAPPQGAAATGPNDQIGQGTQLAFDSTGRDLHACEKGFLQCRGTAERLHDKGYVADSHELYQECRQRTAECYATEDRVQSDPAVGGAMTLFPPEKLKNGGGFVTHLKGATPFFTRPSFDP